MALPQETDRPLAETRRFPRRRPRAIEGRGPLAAGRVIFVMLTTVVVLLLLNAPAMERTVSGGAIGSRRSAELALLRPIARVSSFLSLDRPREWADRLAGHPAPPATKGSPSAGPSTSAPLHDAPPATRGAGPAPVPTTTAPVPPPTTAPPRPVTAAAPLALWVGGDSMAEAFGASFLDLSAATGKVKSELDFRSSTGLARPDYFDWPAELRSEMDRVHPEAVVIMFGANDAQNFEADAKIYEFGGPDWQVEYHRRVGAVMDLLTAGGRQVFWVGQPVMRDASFSSDMQVLNVVYHDEASRHPGVTFIDTRALFADGDGAYQAYLPDASGAPVLMRQGDGIHLTRAGGDRLSATVMAEVARIFHF